MTTDKRYLDREKSWLLFNGRVLQEAADEKNPLIERMRFLGIFSNNLDEFFRVRYATIRRLSVLGDQASELLGGTPPQKLLKEIQGVVIDQQQQYDEIYRDIIGKLKEYKIFIINETELDENQIQFCQQYYEEKLSPSIVPVMLNHIKQFPILRDKSIYHAVRLQSGRKEERKEYALIEIPTEMHPRFIELPSRGKERYIIFLDDLIRFFLDRIFAIFDYDEIEAYTFKFTRDAELDIDNDISRSFIDKIAKSVQARKKAEPVRFVYDKSMPREILDFLVEGLDLDHESDSLIAGGRYHNKRDFMSFPNVGGRYLEFDKRKPHPYPALANPSIMDVLRERDVLLHFPYQSFNYVIRLLREAAIDPKVTTVKATLYRAARNSQFINALINAVRNGKKVTVVIELQARFDEENNIRWTNRLQEEGVNVIYGVPGLKVHSKIILINRMENGQKVRYGLVSTGNFNENTAKLYCDYMLMTSDKRIAGEISKVFKFFKNNYKIPEYEHLIVSPHFTRLRIYQMIDREMENARRGKPAYMHFKMNSLVDKEMIDKIYSASQAGVEVKLNIRGICSLLPGVRGLSENIRGISILGRYLEHARMYIFANGGEEEIYISSADLMTRNLDTRVEVTCPIYDPQIKKELRANFDLGWSDTVKARILDDSYDNKYRERKSNEKKVISQNAFYAYYEKKTD